MAKIGLLFPGQGSQTVGMGKELIENFETAKDIFKKANEVLEIDLTKIIMEGPEEKLKDTFIAQPAILTASIAAWEVIKSKWEPKAEGAICAGHSLGEYSALVAANAIDFEAALKLVRVRGQLMQAAAAGIDGGMAAVIGPSEAEILELFQEANVDGKVQIANLNCPGQTVVSGVKSALNQFSALAQSKGIRVIPLAVSGPFHSTFMKSTADKLALSLEQAPFGPVKYPVISNVSAKPVKEPDAIRRALIEQVSGSVRWTDSINYMAAQGVKTVVEIGPGKVLRGLMKKINKDIKVVNAFTPDEIEKVVEQLNTIA